MLYVFLAVLLLALAGLVVWLVVGPGPRRSRAFNRARQLLQEDNWSEALSILQELNAQPLSDAWATCVQNAMGECYQVACDHALKEKRYEESLDFALKAAPLLGIPEDEQRTRVVNSMLAEVRRLFAAASNPMELEAVLQLLTRLFQIQTECAEASFWLGLTLIRQNKIEPAIQQLIYAHEKAGKQYLDPALYLGMLLYRQGKPADAIRYLSEANRVDASCPFVTLQMGMAMVAAGGDNLLALKALQRALGPRGLSMWLQTPEKAWVEAFPETRSYVRRLASKHRFVCPVLGNSLPAIIRQGQLAMAQAHYRQGQYQEAADLFQKLLGESPPTAPLLRGLGLALARLERYDQAYKHLRTALELEEGKDPFTAGYLALCGALGKPTQPEDKPKNVLWAIKLMARYQVLNNPEWAGLVSAVFAEARELKMTLAQEDQVYLCNILASVGATDPQAAAGYAHLAATFPRAIVPIHAWLYCQAATLHGVKSAVDLDLFARTFQDSTPARNFFNRQKWNFADVEYTYLERTAALHPGRFPQALGPAYPAQGEAFLLERSRTEEEANHKDRALACVEVLLKLAPRNLQGHDRLACLYYREGKLDRAVSLLSGWQRLDPRNHWPVVRQAIIEQQRGNALARGDAIRRALSLTQGKLRAAVAFLGARLALQESARIWKSGGDRAESLKQPLTLLQQCLHDDPDHTEALWCLAAVRSVLGDQAGLAKQAAVMNRPAVKDARFHFLGAVCHLAAQDYAQVLELSQRAAQDQALTAESHYLMAWAHLHLNNPTAAGQALLKVASADKSPSAVYARALLGRLGLLRGSFEEAVKWWNQVEPAKRGEWHIDEPLRQTVLLAGLEAFQKGQFEQAAERFREAGKLGLRDKRLGPLITLALVRAGQRLLYEHGGPPGTNATSPPLATPAAPAPESKSRKSEVKPQESSGPGTLSLSLDD
jgi:tetratricopeptide (TPR) repeat protein